MTQTNLITIKNCRIENSKTTVIPKLDWEMKIGQAWLVIGPNGGGKADFFNALAGNLKILPNSSVAEQISLYSSIYNDSVEIVSLERAAKIIQEERENDESEYVEGGVDIGRTGRVFIAESLCGRIEKNKPMPEIALNLEKYPEIKLCGVENILDRGLKYMSTGEIRRTLLARALVSGKKLLLLSDPFAGLDVNSRKILFDFFDSVVQTQLKQKADSRYPTIILGMERWHEIPQSITHVLEFTNKEISFCGTRIDYEKVISERKIQNEKNVILQKNSFNEALNQAYLQTSVLINDGNKACENQKEVLVKMENVNVGWAEHKVLVNLSWTLNKGEHWLIQGPNGSGKTTFLELITGDNKQVYCNDVWIFGNKRGSGESIWEIKQNLGIVSYRIHVEYRMLGGTSLLNVIVSGLRDTIGLYGAATDVEANAAKYWLKLGGFEGREYENFGDLSYGEQRAVLILRSAVKSPKILILDEPCHGLDEQYRGKILQLLQIIGENGSSTMLHVTHDLSEVLPCEHHILELCPNENPMYKILSR